MTEKDESNETKVSSSAAADGIVTNLCAANAEAKTEKDETNTTIRNNHDATSTSVSTIVSTSTRKESNTSLPGAQQEHERLLEVEGALQPVPKQLCNNSGCANSRTSLPGAHHEDERLPVDSLQSMPTQNRRTALPGAYHGAVGAAVGGLGPTRISRILFSLVGARPLEGDHDDDAMSVPGPVPTAAGAGQLRPISEEGLAVANLVTGDDADEHHHDLQRGTQVEETRRRKYAVGLVMVVVAIGSILAICIVVGITLLFTGDDETNTDIGLIITTPSPSPSNFTPSPEESLESIALGRLELPDYTLYELQDSKSPQAKAFQWLLADPSLLDYSTARMAQRFYLAIFYLATGGRNWHSNNFWLSYGHHECEWFSGTVFAEALLASPFFDLAKLTGLPTRQEDNHIFNTTNTTCMANTNTSSTTDEFEFPHLWLDSNYLQGTLPLELFMLTSLKSISLFSNNLLRGTEGGTISTHIGHLTNLQALGITQMDLVGTIPTEVGQLVNLTYFNAATNMLTGNLPSELRWLAKLNYLQVEENLLSGPIPELGDLSNLRWLYLKENHLTGTIPTTLARMSALEEISIHDNRLSGQIPTELGWLKTLVMFIANDNLLSGTLPIVEWYSRMESLEYLHLARNRLTGQIPSELFVWSSLHFVDLPGNLLTGAFPDLDDTLTTMGKNATANDTHPFGNNLMWISLSNNTITGTIPKWLSSLESLAFLQLQHNELTGVIPESLASIRTLMRFLAQDNQLTGSIPAELGLLASSNTSVLQNMNVGSNNLSGTVPDGLCGIQYDEENCPWCALAFDCSDQLCGCDCSCSGVLLP